MPELPEVETTRRGIEPHIVGEQCADFIVRNGSLRWPVDPSTAAQVVGHSILSVARRAKYLLIQFDHGWLMFHLGMSGSLRVLMADEPPQKHDHIDLVLQSGKRLRFNDPRRFGACLWWSTLDDQPLLSHLGPEPLTDEFDDSWLFNKSRKKTQSVKTFIMDNRVVVGVGNIYANEALFDSGVHPKKAAGKVTRAQYQLLTKNIKKVLANAIERGGTTLRDFVGGDGKPGYFAQELQVYGRAGQPCKACGQVLKEIRLGQRSTVYCTRCQK